MKVASVGAATQAIADHTTSRALARGVAGSLGRPPPLGQSCGLGLCPGRVQDRAQTAHDPRIGGITGPLSRRHSPLAQIVKAVGGRQGETGCGIGQGACDAWPMGARHDDGCTATAPWRIASVRPQRPEPTTSHRERPHGRAQSRLTTSAISVTGRVMTCRDRVSQTRDAPVARQEGPGLRWLTVTPRAQWPVTRSSTCRIPGPVAAHPEIPPSGDRHRKARPHRHASCPLFQQ